MNFSWLRARSLHAHTRKEGPDDTCMSRAKSASFIVRVVWNSRGKVSGVIERVATGAKEAFQGMAAIGSVIARMVEREGAARQEPSPRPRHPTRR
jgi:hypothetical protein